MKDHLRRTESSSLLSLHVQIESLCGDAVIKTLFRVEIRIRTLIPGFWAAADTESQTCLFTAVFATIPV